jgi:acyl-CoA synthetase (AMP-forming)/AMP-acid ligase II
LDLGRTLFAVVERSPDALAIVDGERRLNYAAWYGEISRVGGGLATLGLSRRDRLAVILQNRLEMATLHWACQLVGIVVTPLNRRIKAEELDYCLRDAGAGAIVFDEVAAAAVGGTVAARRLPRIAIGSAEGGTCPFEELAGAASGVAPQAGPEDLSLLLYTSGTTGRPKGVPRRQRAERAAALAHVAQNLYCRGERTLGVMPLYHTMGVRSLTIPDANLRLSVPHGSNQFFANIRHNSRLYRCLFGNLTTPDLRLRRGHRTDLSRYGVFCTGNGLLPPHWRPGSATEWLAESLWRIVSFTIHERHRCHDE